MEQVVSPTKQRYLAARQQLVERHGYENVMAVPRIEKVVLNMGLGEARDDSKVLERASRELAQIALQRPAVTRAKKSVSYFKFRAGMPVGLRGTMRGGRLWAVHFWPILVSLTR